jgi:hypothetical protein
MVANVSRSLLLFSEEGFREVLIKHISKRVLSHVCSFFEKREAFFVQNKRTWTQTSERKLQREINMPPNEQPVRLGRE